MHRWRPVITRADWIGSRRFAMASVRQPHIGTKATHARRTGESPVDVYMVSARLTGLFGGNRFKEWKRLLIRRFSLIAALALSFSASAGGETGAAQAPKVQKPRAVPTLQLPPLPPAVIDNKLVIGGEDIKARKIEHAHDGRGAGQWPRPLPVSGRQRCRQLGRRPAHRARPATADGHADHLARYDRQRARSIGSWSISSSLGQSTIRTLEIPALKEDDLGGEGMVGIDALVNQRLMMDFEKRVIKAEDARDPGEIRSWRNRDYGPSPARPVDPHRGHRRAACRSRR